MNEQELKLSKKLTWKDVYKEFRSKFPNLRKKVMYWCPYGYETIELYLDDGSKATYHYSKNEFKFIKDRWKKD